MEQVHTLKSTASADAQHHPVVTTAFSQRALVSILPGGQAGPNGQSEQVVDPKLGPLWAALCCSLVGMVLAGPWSRACDQEGWRGPGAVLAGWPLLWPGPELNSPTHCEMQDWPLSWLGLHSVHTHWGRASPGKDSWTESLQQGLLPGSPPRCCCSQSRPRWREQSSLAQHSGPQSGRRPPRRLSSQAKARAFW